MWYNASTDIIGSIVEVCGIEVPVVSCRTEVLDVVLGAIIRITVIVVVFEETERRGWIDGESFIEGVSHV